MLSLLARNWWMFAIRGVAAIIFGVIAFADPGLTLAVLIVLFGAYAVVDGLSLLASLVRGDPAARRNGWLVGVLGVISIVAGIIAFVLPGFTAVSVLYLVAAWALLVGVIQLATAITVRREISGELWMALGGVIAILFGVYLAAFPGAGLLSLVWLVGVWAVIFGLVSLFFAWRLRGLHRLATAHA